jgi:predicted ThiF/HesA family dinucleotide-utilizing enzyme
MANTKPIGVAYEDQNIIGASRILTDNELGYTAAAQGTVTQATDKSTAVTLNKSAGQITMNNASLSTATNATFTLNNSLISANDTVILTIAGGQATPGSYNVFANSLSAGSVSITLRNISGGSLSEAVVINFSLIHCV